MTTNAPLKVLIQINKQLFSNDGVEGRPYHQNGSEKVITFPIPTNYIIPRAGEEILFNTPKITLCGKVLRVLNCIEVENGQNVQTIQLTYVDSGDLHKMIGLSR